MVSFPAGLDPSSFQLASPPQEELLASGHRVLEDKKDWGGVEGQLNCLGICQDHRFRVLLDIKRSLLAWGCGVAG